MGDGLDSLNLSPVVVVVMIDGRLALNFPGSLGPFEPPDSFRHRRDLGAGGGFLEVE